MTGKSISDLGEAVLKNLYPAQIYPIDYTNGWNLLTPSAFSDLSTLAPSTWRLTAHGKKCMQMTKRSDSTLREGSKVLSNLCFNIL